MDEKPRMTLKELEKKVQQLKGETISALFKAQSGHPGSSMSIMEVLVSLYFGGILRHTPDKPDNPERDFFLLSNGHACPAWYAVLAEAGYFKKEELEHLRELNAGAQGHPHRGSLPGIEISSGSLGQGLSVGVGLALAIKAEKKTNRIFVLMSDGEQEEGSTWEAVMFAPKHKLNNLIAIIDKNKFQIDGATETVMPGLDPLAQKYKAFNWQVIEIDGHSIKEVLAGLQWAVKSKKPTVIISHTVRGQGVSFMEGSTHWHAGAISAEQYQQALKDLS